MRTYYLFEDFLLFRINVIIISSQTTLKHEVACVDLSPIEANATEVDFCTVGLWTDNSVRLLKLPSLEEFHKESFVGGSYYC